MPEHVSMPFSVFVSQFKVPKHVAQGQAKVAGAIYPLWRKRNFKKVIGSFFFASAGHTERDQWPRAKTK